MDIISISSGTFHLFVKSLCIKIVKYIIQLDASNKNIEVNRCSYAYYTEGIDGSGQN